jgi:hypothetical protein
MTSARVRYGALALLVGCALGLACGNSYDAASASPDAGAEASVDAVDATASSGGSSSIWFFGGRRPEWDQYSYDGFSSRVLEGGVLDAFGAAPTPPFRGLFTAHRRDPDAFWLLGIGIEDIDYGNPPLRRVLLRGDRDERGGVSSWRGNVFAEPSGVTNGSVAHVGEALLYIGGTRTGTDGGVEASSQVYAAKIGPTTGIVQAWQVVSGVTLTVRHVRPQLVVGGGFLYVVGGCEPTDCIGWAGACRGSGCQSTTNEVEVARLDEANGSVGAFAVTTAVTRDGAAHRRRRAGLLVHDGVLYSAGGAELECDATNNPHPGCIGTPDVLFAPIAPQDGQLGQWQATSKLPVGLLGTALHATADRIFAIGGATGPGQTSNQVRANRIVSGGALDVEWLSDGQPTLPRPLSEVYVVPP